MAVFKSFLPWGRAGGKVGGCLFAPLFIRGFKAVQLSTPPPPYSSVNIYEVQSLALFLVVAVVAIDEAATEEGLTSAFCLFGSETLHLCVAPLRVHGSGAI